MQYNLEVIPEENKFSILRKEFKEIEGIELRQINFKNDRIMIIQLAKNGEMWSAFREMLIPNLKDQPDLFRKDLENLYSKEIKAENFEDTPEDYKHWWDLPDKTGIPIEGDVYHIPKHIREIADKIYAPIKTPKRIGIPRGIDYNRSCILHMIDPKIFDEEITKLESWYGSSYYATIQTCKEGSEFKIGTDMDLNAFEVKYGAVEHYIFRKI